MERVVFLRVILGIGLLALVGALVPFSIASPSSRDERALGNSGLPLPRFVSIAQNKANVRRGPGEDYPLLWQYTRIGLPLEIIAEYGQWRQIRDHENAEGWMHARLLRGERSIRVRELVEALPLRSRPAAAAGTVALIQSGSVGRLKDCKANWCEVDVGGHDGWLPRDMLWGVYRFEYNN